jgi:hypothetical protein
MVNEGVMVGVMVAVGVTEGVNVTVAVAVGAEVPVGGINTSPNGMPAQACIRIANTITR